MKQVGFVIAEGTAEDRRGAGSQPLRRENRS
jgi:hypothetical protein